MALEFTPEFIETNKLTPEQVTAVNSFVDPAIATMKLEWDGKANDNAQGILGGIVNSISDKTGFKLEINQGEKHAEYLTRFSQSFVDNKLSTESAEVTRLKADYELKLKDFDGDSGTKEALELAQGKLDKALEKYADYDTLKETAGKYNPLQESNDKLKKQVSYGSVKPNFPDTVNPFEGKAMWSAFTESVEKDWIVEYDFEKNESIAIDKTNPHNIVKLSSLVAKDEALSKLMEGRQQQGTGTTQTGAKTIEGLDFKVDVKAPMSDIHKLIGEELVKKGLDVMSKEYASAYAKNLDIIRKQQTAA